MHVAEAKEKLGSRINWLCDSMANAAKHALGDAPNSEFVIDPDGKIVVARQWSRPAELREDLTELVGEVEDPTTVADIGMKPLAPPKTAPKGIVPRVQLPGRMTPLKVEVSSDLALPTLTLPDATLADPLYVKLRAEIDSEYSREAAGQIYLGFFLDPLYKVHWNNEVAPVAYEIDAPEGVAITPAKGNGPEVDEKADADPREFLLDIVGESDEPIKVTVKYFACDDAETFCKPVTQHYLISLERDRDGGSRRAGSRRPGGLAGGPSPGATNPGPGAPLRERGPEAARRSASLKRAVGLFREHDANKDGQLDQEEFASIKRAPADSDANGDKLVSLRELVDALSRSTATTSEPARSGTANVLLTLIDRDGDGALSTEELKQAGASLRKLDRNDDGEVSAAELARASQAGSNRSGRPNFAGRRPDPREMFKRMDADGDGKITKSEVPEQMRQRWDRMDTDGNGFLDEAEQRAIAERIRQRSPGNGR